MTDRPITIISKPTDAVLNGRQRVDYAAFKESFVEWLQAMGKDPKHATGYADSTARQTSTRIDKFYRWKWDHDGYTTTITEDDADDYMNHIVCSDEEYSNQALANTQKCLKRLCRWLTQERNRDIDWEASFSFNPTSTNARDFFTIDERRKIREAALEYGSVPAYSGLSREERLKWKAHLAQRFEKSKHEVTKSDWGKANGWKIPSMVWVSLDTGLRPIEVERSTVHWVDIENKVLRIPKEESSKNTDNWVVSITDRTASALDRWLTEREIYDQYNGRDEIWLTRQGNPYSSNTLSYTIKNICDIAEIPIEGRTISWYTIRHSLGTAMTGERDLKATQVQLRHKSSQTTMKYDQVPLSDRRDALNNIG